MGYAYGYGYGYGARNGLRARAGASALPANQAPTDIAWAGSHSIAENVALGTTVGGLLSFVDPDAGATGTFSLVDDSNGYFFVDGTSIKTGRDFDFEAAASHNITVRFTDQGGLTYDEVFAVTITDIAETPPAEDPPPDDGTVVDDGGFVNPPIVTVVDGGIKFHGKKASGAAGKFIYQIGTPLADTTYTMHYDPDWSLLSNSGVTAMVAFGFKQGNDFWFAGLKGDGAGGLKAYEVGGAAKFNQTSGFTTVDSGAAAFGTKDGPNWAQLQISVDGVTGIFRTSTDGVTWTDEMTVDPFSDLDAFGNFGIGVFLESADAGHFSVKIDLWIETGYDTGVARFVALNADTLADFTFGTGAAVATWADPVGNAFTQGTAGSRPVRLTGQYAGHACVDFDGSDDWLVDTSLTSPGADGFTFFAIVKFDDTAPYNTVFSTTADGANDLQQLRVQSNVLSALWVNDASYAFTDATNVLLISGWLENFDIDAGLHEVFENGVSKDQSSVGGGHPSAATPTGMRIGRLWNTGFGAGSGNYQLYALFGYPGTLTRARHDAIAALMIDDWDLIARSTSQGDVRTTSQGATRSISSPTRISGTGSQRAAALTDLVETETAGGVSGRSTIHQILNDGIALAKPVVADFSWVNQNTSTVANSDRGVVLTHVSDHLGQQLRGQAKAIPATPFTLTVKLKLSSPQRFVGLYGIGWRKSATQEARIFYNAFFGFPDTKLEIGSTTDLSIISDAVNLGKVFENTQWMRIVDDGTTRRCYASWDGDNWILLNTELGSAYIPDANQIMAFTYLNNVDGLSTDIKLLIEHWLVT